MTIDRAGFFVCLVGPAGSGKTSIASRLIESFGGTLQRSVSVTSRAPRPDEVPGKSYVFVSREEFQQRANAGAFFEWEEVHGNLYGTLRENLSRAIQGGYDLLFDIDIRGALSLRKEFGEAVVHIFVAPPSPEELVARMRQRPGASESDVARRMQTAREEYQRLLDLHAAGRPLDYLVINDSLPLAVEQVQSIITAERLRMRRLARDFIVRRLGTIR